MKEIPLTQGKVAIVDDEDYEYVNQCKWHAIKSGNTFYAVRNNNEVHPRRLIYMHREILNPSSDMQIDHINMNGLDNSRINMRVCSPSQNRMNRGKQINNTSGFKGVLPHFGKWESHIKIDGETKYLGLFERKEDAAKAYNHAAKMLHGEYARLNNI